MDAKPRPRDPQDTPSGRMQSDDLRAWQTWSVENKSRPRATRRGDQTIIDDSVEVQISKSSSGEYFGFPNDLAGEINNNGENVMPQSKGFYTDLIYQLVPKLNKTMMLPEIDGDRVTIENEVVGKLPSTEVEVKSSVLEFKGETIVDKPEVKGDSSDESEAKVHAVNVNNTEPIVSVTSTTLPEIKMASGEDKLATTTTMLPNVNVNSTRNERKSVTDERNGTPLISQEGRTETNAKKLKSSPYPFVFAIDENSLTFDPVEILEGHSRVRHNDKIRLFDKFTEKVSLKYRSAKTLPSHKPMQDDGHSRVRHW